MTLLCYIIFIELVTPKRNNIANTFCLIGRFCFRFTLITHTHTHHTHSKAKKMKKMLTFSLTIERKLPTDNILQILVSHCLFNSEIESIFHCETPGWFLYRYTYLEI